MNSPMKDIPPVPSATSTPGGTYDSNPTSAFGRPRSRGGLPIKMTDGLGIKPGALETAFGDAIELNRGGGGTPQAKAGTLDSPFKDAIGVKE